jgi:hypothetical protein
MNKKISQVLYMVLFLDIFFGHLLDAKPFSEELSTLIADAPSEPVKAYSPHQNRSQMFDPNAMPNNHALWLNGDLLFWKSNMGSLEYGIDSGSNSFIKDGHVKHPHFEWDWGFRLGLGCKLPHDQWDLFVNYTYVRGHAHGHAGGSDAVVFPTWASAFGFTGSSFYAGKAKAHWKMTLNMTDLELGRNCFASRWLSIRPFIGIRGLVIDQDYTVKYFGGTVAPSDEDQVLLDIDFWGVGARMGFDSLWGLGKGFGVYGNGSASLLAGDFDVQEKEKLEKADLRRFDLKNDVDNVVATADLALGVQWDYLFSRNRFHFGVKFGWEFNIFFDQNQLFNFLSSKNPGVLSFKDDDLTFHGLTLGVRFDF